MPPILLKIDSLCETRPEEAMRLLDSIAQEMEQTQEENVRTKYGLLTIKARDKAFIPHTSDSLIKTITDYYDRHGSTNEKIEAYYYYGSVCRDLHDSPGAVSNYTHAIEIAEDAEESIDTLFIANVCAQLAEIFFNQGNYSKATIYTLREDTLMQAIGKRKARNIMDIATMLFHDKKNTDAFRYYEEAIRRIRNNHDFDNNMDLLAEIFSNYAQAGDLYHADIHHALFDSVATPENRPHNHYISKAIYYQHKNIPDSAIHYYKEVYKRDPELDTKCEAARKLLQLYHHTGNDRKALEYGLIQATLQDTVWENLRLQQTADAYNQYLYQRDKQAETEAYKKALDTWRKGVGIASVSGLALFIGLYFFMRHREKNKKTIEKQEQKMKEKDNAIEKQELELQEKDKAIEKQEWELKKKDKTIAERNRTIEQTDKTVDRQDKDLKRLDIIIENHERALKEKKEIIETQENELKKKDETIRTKDDEIQERNEIIAQNQSVIEQQSRQIKETTKKNYRLASLRTQEYYAINTPQLYELFRQAAKGVLKPTEADWMQLQQTVDWEHPDFFPLLQKDLKHLDKVSIRIFYLFKAGFSPTEIQKVTGASRATIYRKSKDISRILRKSADDTESSGEETQEERTEETKPFLPSPMKKAPPHFTFGGDKQKGRSGQNANGS